MTDTTDRDILLGAVEEFCEKRVRDADKRVVAYIRSLAVLPSMRAHQPEIVDALTSLAKDIEDGEHLCVD